MSDDPNDIEELLRTLTLEIKNGMSEDGKTCEIPNFRVRQIAAALELIILRLEDNEDEQEKERYTNDISIIRSKLVLKPVERSGGIINFFIAVMFFLIVGSVFALPLLTLALIDTMFITMGTSKFTQASVWLRLVLLKWLLISLAMDVKLENYNKKHLEQLSLAMYTHGSNIDPLVLGSIIPVGLKVCYKNFWE